MSNAFLDIDDSLLKNNLLLDQNKHQEDELGQLFKSLENPNPTPFVLVRPIPGVCLKMRMEGSGEKGFINICHTSEIPSPEDISVEKLLTIVESSNPSFVIPMSIGQERLEPDKGDSLCCTYDVAISTTYFNKCQMNKIFMTFTLDIMVEAINNKYNKSFDLLTTVLLKNRKVMGTLQQHRIEKREIRKPQFPKKLIEEVQDRPKNSKKTEPIPVHKSSSSVENVDHSKKLRTTNNSDYIILRKPSKGNAEHLIGLFKLPILNAKDVSVHVGEDRIIVEASEKDYLVDVFVPYFMDQEKVSAEMDSTLGILRLNMPLKCCKFRVDRKSIQSEV